MTGDLKALRITAACHWECVARKPGNVNRHHDFSDSTLADFLISASLVGPILSMAGTRGVGAAIYSACAETRARVGTNTNLGLVLALAPLAAVPDGKPLREGVGRVLANLDRDDSKWAFQGIAMANPGGLGASAEQDVRQPPSSTLLEAMRLAADRDSIARQYANGYADLFDLAVPTLGGGLQETGTLEGAIVLLHLHLMSLMPDTHIARRAGIAEAEEAASRAAAVARAGWPKRAEGWKALKDFDTWLRVPGTKRNPGTTADLVGATLYIALVEGLLELPCRFPWWDHESPWP